jgi:hypothetical protein
MAAAARVGARIIERIYYKPQSTYDAQWVEIERRKANAADALERATKAGDEPAVAAARAALAGLTEPEVRDVSARIGELSALVYAYADERSKTRALLCHSYHHARHERFHVARDMLLMSHLQDSIAFSDVSTQILFNRALVRVGLAAFHAGAFAESVTALNEMVSANRQRELLAQGLSSARYHERNPELEKVERRRQVPFHMHISLELVEACFLVGTLLLEMPLLCAQRADPKRRIGGMSKALRRLIDSYDKLVFAAPAEHLREHIVCAANQMLEGEWQAAVKTITSLPVWDQSTDPAATREMLRGTRSSGAGESSAVPCFSTASSRIDLVAGRQAGALCAGRRPSLAHTRAPAFAPARARAPCPRAPLPPSVRLQEESLRAFVLSFASAYKALSLEQLAARFELSTSRAHAIVSKMLTHAVRARSALRTQTARARARHPSVRARPDAPPSARFPPLALASV